MISHRAFGILETIPEDSEEDPEEYDEGWTIDPTGLAAARTSTGETRSTTQPWTEDGGGEPGAEPRQRTMAEEQEDRRKHREEQKKWDQIWMRRASEKDWDQVRTPLEAYRYSGFKVRLLRIQGGTQSTSSPWYKGSGSRKGTLRWKVLPKKI